MHKSMIPPGISGKVISAAGDGSYNILTPLITVEDKKGIKHEIALAQKWPIKYTRPSSERLSACEPLVTGQRVIDTLFPIAKGGAAAVPGSFGTGKTMVQHQIAKWSDADIIVYIGCGERGNEMTRFLRNSPSCATLKRKGADRAHRNDCQHLEYARCGARGFYLYRSYTCGILP